MASHIELGKHGERLAASYLATRGFKVLSTNWRYSHYEIDIIASSKEVLHFIEVKTRRGKTFGLPEESVSKSKFAKLLNAAAEYQHQCPGWKRVQYDVLAIFIGRKIEYFFMEDVFI